MYVSKQNQVGQQAGRKVCSRRRKSSFRIKLNMFRGVEQHHFGVIVAISLSRRYKTFGGMLKYSTGAINCLNLFSGATLGSLIKTYTYFSNPKLFNTICFSAGSVVPVAFLQISVCFFNIVCRRSEPAWFCLAGGTFCTITRINTDRGFCVIKIPSNNSYVLHETTFVMLGRNSNNLPKGIRLGKAGVNIHRGFRPAVRGVAKNPVDHPHGGRTKTNSPERTPWGKIAKKNK